MVKVCRIGTIPYHNGRMSLHVEITMPKASANLIPCENSKDSLGYEHKNLSISGVEGSLPSGNCKGSCGQIDTHYRHRNPKHDDKRYNIGDLIHPYDISFDDGWDIDKWYDLLEVWHLWHLKPMSEVPISVKIFLLHLPECKKQPAWI